MPTLPHYTAQRNINPQVAAPFRDEVTQEFANQRQIIGTLQEINQRWQNANDVMQYTEAKAKYDVAATDIQMRAANDPDYKNSDKYVKELERAKDRSLDGVANQEVANQLNVEFSHDNAITGMKIGAGFKSKQMEAHRYNLQTDILSMYGKKTAATTDAERLQISNKINQSLQYSVDSGLISPEDAATLNKKAELNAVENLIYSNPQAGVAQINAGYFNLTPEEKGKLIEEAHQIDKKNKDYSEWQLQQTQTQGTVALSEALQNNTLTPQMVRDMQQSGVIDSETAAIFDGIALKKNYEIPESTSLGQPDYFLRLLEDSNGDKPQVKKILKDAATAYGDHKIGTNQYLYFVQQAKEIFNRQSKGIFTKSDEQNKFTSSVEGIKEYFQNIGKDRKRAEKDFDKAMTTFTDRYKPGDDPQKIKNEVLNQYNVKIKPEIENFPENGKLMIDKNGNKAMVFPDGRIEEVK